jgi:hypothetical protein
MPGSKTNTGEEDDIRSLHAPLTIEIWYWCTAIFSLRHFFKRIV